MLFSKSSLSEIANNGIDAIYFNYYKRSVAENIKSVHHLLEIKQYL